MKLKELKAESLLSFIKTLDLSAESQNLNLLYIQRLIIQNRTPVTSVADVTCTACYIPSYDDFVVSAFIALISMISGTRYYFNRIRLYDPIRSSLSSLQTTTSCGEVVYYSSSDQSQIATYLTVTLSQLLVKKSTDPQLNRTDNYRNIMICWVNWIIDARAVIEEVSFPAEESRILDSWLRQHLHLSASTTINL